MSYCTTDDIQKRFKSLELSTTTAVKTATVQEFIDSNSEAIDARLDKIYVTPITGPKALAIVKLICVYQTVSDVEDVMRAGDAKESRSMSYRKLAESMLEKIEASETDLTDAVRRGTNFSQVSTLTVAGNSAESFFKRDQRQW